MLALSSLPRQAFCEATLFDEHWHEVTSRDVLHDKIKVVFVLKIEIELQKFVNSAVGFRQADRQSTMKNLHWKASFNKIAPLFLDFTQRADFYILKGASFNSFSSVRCQFLTRHDFSERKSSGRFSPRESSFAHPQEVVFAVVRPIVRGLSCC